MSDKPEGTQPEVLATKEEVKRLADEMAQIKELLRSLTMSAPRSMNPPSLETSRRVEVGTDQEEAMEAELQQRRSVNFSLPQE